MREYISELINKMLDVKFTSEADFSISLLDTSISAEQALYVLVQFAREFKIDIKYIYDNAVIYSVDELCKLGRDYKNNTN